MTTIAPSTSAWTTAPSWRTSALCLHHPPETFFPLSGQSTRTASVQHAIHICEACPVSGPCLSYALDNDVTLGIYGGLTAAQRARLVAAST